MRYLVLLALLVSACALPAVATDGAKWFVCKYVGTPGLNEVLQTGDNPISVSASAIATSPVVAGAWFADSQGRSYVLELDTGQPEPDPSECPPPNVVPPSPTPSPSASLSASPSVLPSSPASEPPTAELFTVEVCPATGEPVASGQSLIRFRHPLLVLLLLNVRIDGDLVTLREVAGTLGVEGGAGEVVVSVGVHDWSISNPADTEVLAAGTVNCPECNPASPTPPPATIPEPSPTPNMPDTATGG